MPAATDTFNFSNIESIQHVQQWKQVDVCGVVAEVGQVENKNLKSGEQKAQRNVVLIDDSGYGISIGLWGLTCNRITEQHIHSVVVFKGVSVSDYSGKSLNFSDKESKISTEIVNERTSALKRWYSDLK